MSGFQLGAFRPVETPDLGATLSRMAAIDAQRQQTALARQAFEQDQGFNRTLAAAAPGLASGQGPAYDSAVASIAAAGPRGLTVALPLLQRSQDRREAADFWRQGSGATPAVAPAGGATLPPGDPSLPRGLRNNNPLNLTYVAGQPGVQGSDGRFGRYATPEEGIAASVRQLQMYGQRGLTTPTQIIGQWAPPSENNTGSYVAAVSRAAGLDPNQPVDLSDPAVVSRLVGAMAQHENGRPLDPAVVQRGVQMGLGGGAAPASAPASAPQAGGINPAELALLERALQSGNPQIVQQAQRRMELLRLRQGMNPVARPPQPTQTQQDRARYIDLAQRRASLSPAEAAELSLLELGLGERPQVAVGPNGIAIVPGRPLPLSGGGIPQDAAPASQQPGGLAQPVNDASPGVAPAPTQRQPQAVTLPDGRTAQYIPAEQPPAQIPQAMAAGMLENANGLRQARLALQLAEARPASFGFWQGSANMVPGALERIDPGGVDARAMAANLGSLVIHQRSGAAVTASEFPRLRPFIPAIGDPPAVVRTKIAQFVREYEAILRDQYQAFGPESGYRQMQPVEETLRAAAPAERRAQEPAQSVGPGGTGEANPPPAVTDYDVQGRRIRR